MRVKKERRNTPEAVEELKSIGPTYEKEDVKVSTTLENLATDKQDNSSMGQRVYSVPSQEKLNRSKLAQKSGQVPQTVNVYGSHYPVVKLLDDKTLLLHTSDYGTNGKTKELVAKIKQDLPNHFPDHKVIEIHHPDYRHSAKVMRTRNPQALSDYLKLASEKHPDENYRAHALSAIEHLSGMKKAEYGKPIHAKRTASEGFDYDQNLKGRVDRIHNYLSKLGLQLDTSEGKKRNLGSESPNTITINTEGDPHDQQALHEAGHALLTSPNQTISEYQQQIGKPGFEGKLTQTRNRQALMESHGGGMPEQTAQHMEGLVARRSGIEPFKSPKRGKEGGQEEKARAHAKQTVQDLDEGIYKFNFKTGKKELQSNPNTIINARARGDKNLVNKMTEKYKRPKDMKLAANEDTESDLAKGSLQRRLGNPKKHVSEKEGAAVADWTENENRRDKIPEATPEAKQRFFQKLHAKTEVRKHPKTGERMFLMHRGVDGLSDKDIDHQTSRTSWTPDLNVAQKFARGQKGRVYSSWIPESAIHNYVNNALGTRGYLEHDGTGQHSHEQEFIVKPHNFIYAKRQKLPKNELINARINNRQQVTDMSENLKVNGQRDQSIIDEFNRDYKKLAASEDTESDLTKGSLQSRLKYNPNKISQDEAQRITDWQKNRGDRNSIPKLDENGRQRALMRLGRLTEVRRDPETGKRLFLLHRGMGEEERGSSIGQGHHMQLERKSWTPRKSIADSFARRYSEESGQKIHDAKKSKAVSAWIHEDDIHSYLPQTGSVGDKASFNSQIKFPNDYMAEHEVIVDHTRWNPLASEKTQNTPNDKINTRFERRVDKSKIKGKKVEANMPKEKIWHEEKNEPRLGQKRKNPNPYVHTAADTESEKLAANENIDLDMKK